MPRSRPHTVRKGKGTMCNVCGRNCGRGGPLRKHLEQGHRIAFADYKKCFGGVILVDEWDDSLSFPNGQKVITHTLVRRFPGDPSWRKVRGRGK